MKNINAHYTGHDATLTVFARQGAKDIRVAVQVKTNGAKAVTGCKNIFALDHDAEATAKFEALKADAMKQGWTPRVGASKSAFNTMPIAPKAVAKK
jgi:hypothetical protein